MAAEIHDRGRGPEIKGTRITVQRVFESVLDGSSPAAIAEELRLTVEQARASVDYIEAHRAEVKAENARIRALPCTNPPWVEAGKARFEEELLERLRARLAARKADARPGRS